VLQEDILGKRPHARTSGEVLKLASFLAANVCCSTVDTFAARKQLKRTGVPGSKRAAVQPAHAANAGEGAGQEGARLQALSKCFEKGSAVLASRVKH